MKTNVRFKRFIKLLKRTNLIFFPCVHRVKFIKCNICKFYKHIHPRFLFPNINKNIQDIKIYFRRIKDFNPVSGNEHFILIKYNC